MRRRGASSIFALFNRLFEPTFQVLYFLPLHSNQGAQILNLSVMVGQCRLDRYNFVVIHRKSLA